MTLPDAQLLAFSARSLQDTSVDNCTAYVQVALEQCSALMTGVCIDEICAPPAAPPPFSPPSPPPPSPPPLLPPPASPPPPPSPPPIPPMPPSPPFAPNVHFVYPGVDTLYDAINNAQSEDVLLLQDGNYTRDDGATSTHAFYIYRSVTIRAVNPGRVVLDGQRRRGVVYVSARTLGTAIRVHLEGLRITGGSTDASDGAGLVMYSGVANVQSCVFDDNTCLTGRRGIQHSGDYDGGAVAVKLGGVLRAESSIFRSNSASGRGGAFAVKSRGRLEVGSCQLSNNQAGVDCNTCYSTQTPNVYVEYGSFACGWNTPSVSNTQGVSMCGAPPPPEPPAPPTTPPVPPLSPPPPSPPSPPPPPLWPEPSPL